MNDIRTELRRRLLDARKTMPSDLQLATSEELVPRVLRVMADLTPGVVAGYLSYGGELDLIPTLEALIERGWQAVIPKCGDDASMVFCPWSPGDPVVRSRLGVSEPLTQPVDCSEIDALLVPGVGFDDTGARIGHGVGFYDRFFAGCAVVGHQPLRIGIAHDVQVVRLPAPEPWDVAMHHLVTPTRVISL